MNDTACGQNSETVFKVGWQLFLVRKEDPELGWRNKWVFWMLGLLVVSDTQFWVVPLGRACQACVSWRLGDTVIISLYMFTFEFFSPWNIPPDHPSNPWLQWLSEATAYLTFSVRFSSLVAPLLSSGSPPGTPPASVLCIPLPSRGSSEALCLHSDAEMKLC